MPFVFALLVFLGPLFLAEEPVQVVGDVLEVDRFEGYEEGNLPGRWKYFTRKNEIRPIEEFLSEGESVVVLKEEGNQFLRTTTEGESLRISLANTDEFGLDWDMRSHPVLSWRWRAHHLPEGASEADRNDAGGGVYVTLERDWLGRPRSIKYTYSTTLPVGTVVSFGRLKVIVAASGLDGIGSWKDVRRNVAEDYRDVFGGNPPDRPLLVTIWSDSDDTDDRAEVDIDDIILLSESGPY